MGDVVVTEFITRSESDDLAGEFEVINDPELHRDVARLGSARGRARTLIIRNRLGAALDVFAEEAPGPATLARLAGRHNLISTPHIAGLTEKSDGRVAASAVAQVREVLAGA